MKKALLIALSLFATSDAVKASPQFTLTQGSAGNLIFQGVGTAQYNNSIGTNNSFQVGSSTNLGVNASTSSTPEYAVESHAKLDLAGNSTLKQIIGTSGSSSSQTAEQVAAMTYAHDQASSSADQHAQQSAYESAHSSATTSATSVANTARSTWESDHSSTWTQYFEANGGVVDTDSGDEDSASFSADATYQSKAEWESAYESTWQTAYDVEYDAAYESAYTSDYSAAYENKYQSEYSSVYTDAISNIQTNSTAESTAGVIKGTFTTQEYGASESGGSMADWQQSAQYAASESVELTYLADWAAYVDYNTVTTTDENDVETTGLSAQAAYQTEAEYDAARSDAYSTAYNQAYSNAMTSSSRTSSSDVEVTGIGSDASVTSAATSTFDVKISTTLADSSDAESTATANGAAGANLSTSSFANQSQASTASAFMQAFGGDGL